MLNRSIVLLIAIILTIGSFIWLSRIGFNSSTQIRKQKSLTVDNKLTDSPISKAVNSSDTSFLSTIIFKLETGDTTYINDVDGLLAAYQFLINNNLLTNDSRVRFAELKIKHATADEDFMVGITTCLEVVKSDPDHIPALEFLGEMSIRSGQLDKAKERYQKLLILRPLNEHYQMALNLIEAQLGKSQLN